MDVNHKFLEILFNLGFNVRDNCPSDKSSKVHRAGELKTAY